MKSKGNHLDSRHGLLPDSNASELAGDIRSAIGATPDEAIEVVTPQFGRAAGTPDPSCPPSSLEGFRALRGLSTTALMEMGVQQWNAVLWLYPGEWFDHIPMGLDVVSIFGKAGVFNPRTDNDIRFGCLSFGFIRDEDVPRWKENRAEDWC
jgi:hypothetical protein